MVDFLRSPHVTPLSFLLSFFAGLNACAVKHARFVWTPFLFFAFFFAGLADSFIPTHLLYMPAPLWC